MGALNPLFLLAAVAVGVPIFLHLFQRQQARRFSFPALRYLERTEREHARQIRFRQLLLLLLRVAVMLVVVAAGARLFLRGRGAAHPPTALAIVLDNSASSGLVVGERRVLDGLKERAAASLAAATPEDRIWVLRAGEPWRPAAPLDRAGALREIEETEVSAAAGDLERTVARAAGLLRTSSLPNLEIHLLSDLQATAFPTGAAALAEGIPVVALRPPGEPAPNHALVDVLVGGGLPPLRGERTEVTVRAARGAESDTTRVPVRVVIDDRIRGAATVPLGSASSIPLPPAAEGWVRGWVESDPDALRADDRRAFAFRVRPPPRVTTSGEVGRFVDDALEVLAEAGRIVRVPSGGDLLVTAAGEGVDGVGGGGAVLVVPPPDPARLPALNRRLAEAGIPWSYTRRADEGEAALTGPALPEVLAGVRAAHWYRLAVAEGAGGAPRTLAEAGGTPWAVEGHDAAGRRYLLIASALDESSGTLPVSPAMVRFLDWTSASWAAVGGEATAHGAGEPLGAPRGATHVRLPSGEETELDGTRSVRETAEAGFYTFLAADSVVAVAAVNPPGSESDLRALTVDALAAALGERPELAGEAAWTREIFRVRQGPELWWPLLVAAALLLAVESLLATSGRGRTTRQRATAGGHGAD